MKQKGFILIVSLIFLVIMTILGIAMFRGVSMDETMSGNQREKSRSVEAAQGALDSAEGWLNNGNNTIYGGTMNSGVACAGTLATPTICSTALANPTTLPWASFFAASGIIPASSVSASGQNTYVSQPQYYIQFLGYAPGSTNIALYQVTATAQGGNSTATSVIQAVYQVQNLVHDPSL